MFLLLFIQTLFFILPLLLFFIYKRKNKEKIVRVILFYIIYCILQEFLTYWFTFNASSHRGFVIYLFSSYTIIEFLIFCAFYYYLFPPGHGARKAIKFIGLAFAIFAIADFFFINKNQSFDSFTIAIESIALLLLCGYYLYYQITTTFTMFVYRTFNFWVIVTFLMFISATFFLYLMTDTMGEDPEFRKYYFFINFGANLLKNILLCFAISRKHVLSPEKQPEKTPEFNLDLGDDIILQKNI